MANLLSWKGYALKDRMTMDAWSERLAIPLQFFETIPYCIESYSEIRLMSSEQRCALQKKFLELTDHSVMGCIFVGVMRADEADRIKHNVKLCLDTIIRLIQVLAQEDLNGPEMTKIFKALSPATSGYLKTSLASSCYYFVNDCGPIFDRTLDQPLYFELATDLLCNGTDLLFAEFQVRYGRPYPHLLTKICKAYEALFPDLFQRFGLTCDCFEAERNRLLGKALDNFASMAQDKPRRLVLDAWAAVQNSGSNWIKLAQDLQMGYVLFDDLTKGCNIYEEAYKNERLACFNQPPLCLVDPSHRAFRRVTSEQFEVYEELEWAGLTDRYLNGEVFFANSPLCDIANDKAIYPALAELCRLFFAEDLQLPIMKAAACWLEDDHRKPDQKLLSSAIKNKDDYVIAHRYLEGGLGMRVGRVTQQNEWEDFIQSYVVERPYLFVLREHFSMHPDLAHRIVSACYRDNLLDAGTRADITLSDTCFTRFDTRSPLMSDNYGSVLVFPASAHLTAPKYEFSD